MIRKFYKLAILLWLMVFQMQLCTAQVEYKIEILPDSVTYQVSMRPQVTWTGGQAITSSAQVTIKVPTGGFEVDPTSVTSLNAGTFWAYNSTYLAPPEAAGFDYLSFGLTSNGTSGFTYTAGVETPIFTFVNTGACTGSVALMELGDPFYPPNSQQGNVGNQITTFGGGPQNAWIGNYSPGLADCNGSASVATCDIDSVLATNETDCQQNDGSIIVNATSNGTLEYSIDGGISFQSDNTFMDVAPGSYDVVVRTVGNACTNTYSNNPVVVTEVSVPLLSLDNSSDPTDCNANDGSITLSATGGTGSYEFSIDGSNYFGSGEFTNLTGGTYPISVRNANGTCVVTGNDVFLSSPAMPFFSNVTTSQPSGCGVSDGSISISAMGGIGAYQYSIDGGANWFSNGTFNGLADGSYPVMIRNANGTCEVAGAIVEINSPTELSVAVAVTPESNCNANDASIQITASNGSGNYLYSIDNGATYSTSGLFENVLAGNYTVKVKNADNSCETEFGNNPVNVTDVPCPTNCQVEYVLETIGNGRYQVSMLPSVTWTGTDAITSTAQVTILAPTGGFSIDNFMDLIPGVTFEHNATYIAPSENPGFDYFIVGLTSNGTTGITYQQGVKTPLFTFENTGVCSGLDIFLLDNSTDPFLPPNSEAANIGQQLSNIGGGQDIPICTSTDGVPCEATVVDIACKIAYELETLPNGDYQVSLISDTTWTGTDAITSTAQVTVVTPHDGFVVTNLNNLIPGVDFAQNAIYQAPMEATDKDYLLFGLTSVGTSGITYEKGLKVPLFTFSNGGACTGDSIYLMPIEGDPFEVPNSQNGNVGQQLTTAGSGTDADLCIIGGSVPCLPCGPNSLDTDGDGICDNQENIDGSDPSDPCDPNINANNCNYVCPELFGTDTIYWNGNDGPVQICTDIDLADWNNYDIEVDQQSYTQPPILCESDTLMFYTYAFTDGQGNDGPYEVVYWYANNIPYTAVVADMDMLAAQMNVWDVGGNWQNNSQFSVISGGQAGVTYGNMILKNLQSNVETLIQTNFTFVGSSSIIEVSGVGEHELIVTNDNTCADTVIVLIYEPTVDTIMVSHTTDSTTTTFCVDQSQIPDGGFTTSICNEADNGTLTDNGDGCFTYEPDTDFVGLEEVCIVICSETSPAICDTTIVQIDVEQYVCEEIFNNDTVYLLANNHMAEFCVPVTSSANSTYDILVDAENYTAPLNSCDFDTLVFYSYAFVSGQGNTGPYQVTSWVVNGQTYSTMVNDMDALAAWMNSIEGSNVWMNTGSFAALSGGNVSSTYGHLKIRQVSNNVPTTIAPNYSTISNGLSIKISGLGPHEVILDNQLFECSDTITVVLVEPEVDTVTVVVPSDSMDVTLCLDTDELPGNPTAIDLCENPSDGSVTLVDNTCLTYQPDAGFFGEDQFCVVICDDSPTEGPFCDTTIVTVIRPPLRDTLGPKIIDPMNPTVFCIDSLLQFPGMITSVGTCGFDDTVLDVMPMGDDCFIFQPALEFVGTTDVCVLNCYESSITMTEVCDTTIIRVVVLPVTDTVEVTLTEWTPTSVCFDNEINLAGNNTSLSVCGNNDLEVMVTADGLTCVELDPKVGFQGLSEICVLNCDDSVPALCDTTIILVTVEIPCPDVFGSDTLYTVDPSVCTPINPNDYGIYDIIVDNEPYVFPQQSCDEDTLVFYSYSFVGGMGNAGPYQVVSWNVNGQVFSGVVADMNQLAMQMNMWAPGTNWTNDPSTSSVSSPQIGSNFGNIILRQISSGVETLMNPNITEISQGSLINIGNAGTHELVVIDTTTSCSDTVTVIYIDTTPDTLILTLPPNTSSDPLCLDESMLPGIVTTSLCGGPTNGTVTFTDLDCLTYTPSTGFFGIDEICVELCSDQLDQYGDPICKITTIQIIVQPPTDNTVIEIPGTDGPSDPEIVCLDDYLQVNLPIAVTSICSQNLTQVSVTTNGTECVSVSPVAGFVGVSDVCVLHCYEAFGTTFCDTTYLEILVIPPTDTIAQTITGYDPEVICLSDFDVTQLAGNLANLSLCGNNDANLNVNILSNDCIEVTGVQGFIGTSSICVVQCDDFNPQFCDTTIIDITIDIPCTQLFDADSIAINVDKFCAPIPLAQFSIYDIIINNQDYVLPPVGCDVDSLVFYTYSFIAGAGNSGPYLANWTVNGVNYSSTVEDMDALAAQMTIWNNGNEWFNDTATSSVRTVGNNSVFGTLVLTHIATSVPAFMNANYTPIAFGSCLQLDEPGWHEVIVNNTNTGCSDTIYILYYDNTPSSIDLTTDNASPTDETCLDVSGLPGAVDAVSLCDTPTNGSVTFNGECFTYTPNGFFTGIDEFCVVVCDDTPAPWGPICDTTYVNVNVGEPDCPTIFTESSYTIVENTGTGSGTFCTPINTNNWDIYDLLVNGQTYNNPPAPCDIVHLIYYTYSFTVGTGQDGPYLVEGWELNGQVYSGTIQDMDALAAWMNQLDPEGNWVNDPFTSAISGGDDSATYGNMILRHLGTGVPAVLNPNTTSIANGAAMELPIGTNTVVFTNPDNGCVYEIQVTVEPSTDVVILNSKVFLQGAYDPNTGMMEDNLRVLGLIPEEEPYSNYNPIPGVFRFNHIGGGGGETIDPAVLSVSGADAIVDWVFLELRSDVDETEILATRAALIQRDGDIVDVDGVSPVVFDAPAGDYYLAIRHRNHLSVMSANTYSLSNLVTTVDFTDADTQLWGTYAMHELSNGQQVMWGGDANGSGTITFQGGNNDPDAIFFNVLLDPVNNTYDQNYIFDGYSGSDTNMDGKSIYQGTNNDIDLMIFFNVVGHPSSNFVINFVVIEQLP